MKAFFKRITTPRLQLMAALFCIHVLFQVRRVAGLPHRLVLKAYQNAIRDSEAYIQSRKGLHVPSCSFFLLIACRVKNHLRLRRLAFNGWIIRKLTPLTVWANRVSVRTTAMIADLDFLSYSDRGYASKRAYANDILNGYFNPASKTQFNGPGARIQVLAIDH